VGAVTDLNVEIKAWCAVSILTIIDTFTG